MYILPLGLKIHPRRRPQLTDRLAGRLAAGQQNTHTHINTKSSPTTAELPHIRQLWMTSPSRRYFNLDPRACFSPRLHLSPPPPNSTYLPTDLALSG